MPAKTGKAEYKTLDIFTATLIVAVILQASGGGIIYLDRLFTL